MEETKVRYLLLGGGLAAASAVEGIRELDAEGSILVVGDEPHPPYHRPPLTKGLLLGKKKPGDVFCKPETFYQEKKVTLSTGVPAVELRVQERSVVLADGRRVSFESLLLATGSRARRLQLPGEALPGVFTVRTLDDAVAFLAAMKQAGRAVVIGGGYIGAEAASALTQNGIQTTMVFPEARFLDRMTDSGFGAFLHGTFLGRGVTIKAGQRPVRFQGKERVESVITEGGQEIPAEIVVLGVGAELNTDLFRKAGFVLGAGGGVPVDGLLRTDFPGVFAAGDIAEYPDPTFGKRLRLEHWDAAYREGLTAGRNMAGAREPYTALPHYFTTLFGLGFSVWGDLSGWDETLKGDAPWESGPQVHYLEKGRLCGLLAFDPVEKEEETAIEEWVRKRPVRSEVLRRVQEGESL
jgi:3-phenylpropionate/trans-cinnamate dioxygenase ferredoxin reductase component